MQLRPKGESADRNRLLVQPDPPSSSNSTQTDRCPVAPVQPYTVPPSTTRNRGSTHPASAKPLQLPSPPTMATLERSAPPSLASLTLDDVSELSATVPTPFPVQEAQALGRTSSRSPSATRGLGGLMDKVKRAMSRDRGDGVERSRTRETHDTGEPFRSLWRVAGSATRLRSKGES